MDKKIRKQKGAVNNCETAASDKKKWQKPAVEKIDVLKSTQKGFGAGSSAAWRKNIS